VIAEFLIDDDRLTPAAVALPRLSSVGTRRTATQR